MENKNLDIEIFNAVLTHQIQDHPELFSHDTIGALALVNRHLNGIVERSSSQRKAYLTHQTNPTLDNQTTWHKYNSAYAYWTDYNEFIGKRDKKDITFHLIYLQGNSATTVAHSTLLCLPTQDCTSSHLIFEVDKPFFNSKGDACFHAQGQCAMQKDLESCALCVPFMRPYEYLIHTQGKKRKKIPCLKTIITSKPAIETSHILDVVLPQKVTIPSESTIPFISHKDDHMAAQQEVKRLQPLIDNALNHRERSFVIVQYLRATDMLGTTLQALSNQERYEKKTMLHSAVVANNLPVVKLIIAAAEKLGKTLEIISIQDDSGKTALDYAIQFRFFPDRREEGMDKILQSYCPIS